MANNSGDSSSGGVFKKYMWPIIIGGIILVIAIIAIVGYCLGWFSFGSANPAPSGGSKLNSSPLYGRFQSDHIKSNLTSNDILKQETSGDALASVRN